MCLVVLTLVSCKKESQLVETTVNGVKVLVPADSVSKYSEKIKVKAKVQKPKVVLEKEKITKFPKITFEHKSHDFGTIKQGEIVEYSFKFTNTGEADLLIQKAHGSCGCTIPEYPKEPIKPGETGKIRVSFNSAAKKGLQKKTVWITANTITQKENLTITAQVTFNPTKGSGITTK